MNSSWGSAAIAPNGRQRRNGQAVKTNMTALTMSSLGGIAGGILAGKAFASGKDKPSRPSKDAAQNPPSQTEPNYTQHTHGSNSKAQVKPVTYDNFKGSSVSAQAGSSKSSSTHSSHPQPQQRPHRPHAHTSSGPQSHGAATATNVGAHPLATSVLASNPAAQKHPHHQVRPGPRRQGTQPPPTEQGMPTVYDAASGATHLMPSTWAHDTPVIDATNSAATVANHKQNQPSTSIPTSVPQKVVVGDMNNSGFMFMHSQYNANKHGKSGLNAQPTQTLQVANNQHYSQAPYSSLVAYQQQPQQISHPGPVYQQQQQQQQQQHNSYPTQQYQQHYGSQPILVPAQAPATQHGYGGYAPQIAHSYSTQLSGPMRIQAHTGQYGELSRPQHQQYPQANMSHSVPASYDTYSQPQGLAASYQNAAYSSPQLVYPSIDVVAGLRPKKHVHFADYS
ncbi:hypothetical protein GGI20_000555 [Coemansia sp. BCRC 34301]|nr:hypothetical protein GGI20_000555 [Coemansia sp. BCRC 34301]